MKRIAVIVRTSDPARVAEALRGAVGLTLRGDAVRVALAPEAAPHAEPRAVATLTSFGHAVGTDVAATLRDADAVEVWT